MNLYKGNTGERRYVAEEPEREHVQHTSPLPPPETDGEKRTPPPETKKPPGPLHNLMGGLDGILSRLDPSKLEMEDLLVLAILWLLYRESGDRELLIAMGAYLFLSTFPKGIFPHFITGALP